MYTHSSGWSLSQTRRWVWQDWLPLLELDGNNTVIRKYTWGHDLAMSWVGQHSWVGRVSNPSQASAAVSESGAGGIGGLLAISDPNDPNDPNDLHGDWTVFYGASGNVGQLVDWAHDPNDPNNSMDARYEYDAYGNLLTSAGSYAAENPIRFSTKHWDSETGMGYWGYRFYDPRLGRWINRDPIGERGGMNLYGYVRNQTTTLFDPDGRFSLQPGGGSAGGGCSCKAEIKANGAHLYIHFQETGCGDDYTGNAHWGPCGFIGMCPCGSLNGDPYPPGGQGCFSGSGNNWGDRGGKPAKGGVGPQTFPGGSGSPCECLKDIMDAKYGTYFLFGPNSNSAAMEAAAQCCLDTSGVTGYPGQGVSPGPPVEGGLEGTYCSVIN